MAWTLETLKRLFAQKTPGVRRPGDGILHRLVDPGGADKVWAERQAVQHALRTLGHPNPSEKDVEDYAAAVQRFVNANPGNQNVLAYTAAARGIRHPEPRGNDVNPASAGGDLPSAVRPMVELASYHKHAAERAPLLPVLQKRLDAVRGKAAGPAPAYEVVPDEERELAPAVQPGIFERHRVELPPREAPGVRIFTQPKVTSRVFEPDRAGTLALPGGKPPDRKAALDAMLAAGHDREAIVQHLMNVHGLKRPSALRALREHVNRKVAAESLSPDSAAPAGQRPLTLARPGEAALGRITAAEINDKKVDPRIRGTALAFHLKWIAKNFKGDKNVQRLAEDALRGNVTPGHDPYAMLGEHFAATNHRFSRAYEWKHVGAGLARDAVVEDLLNRHLKSPSAGLSAIREHWDRIQRQLGTGKHDRSHSGYDAFWHNLRNYARQHADSSAFSDALLDDPAAFKAAVEASMHRIGERHHDREYLADRVPAGAKAAEQIGQEPHPVTRRLVVDPKGIRPVDRIYGSINDPTSETGLASTFGHLPGETKGPRSGAKAFKHAREKSPIGHGTTLSIQAHEASKYSGLFTRPSQEAVFKANAGKHIHAYRLHNRLAGIHEAWAEGARGFNDPQQATVHAAAAKAHRRAEGFHRLQAGPGHGGWYEPEDAPATHLARSDKQAWISAKIKKIMKDGIKGRKVDVKQAAAAAYSMWREGNRE